MALIILEGLDRTGKSSLAKEFESEGYELIHMSAPSKKYNEPGYTGPSYLDEMMDLLHQAAHRDIVLDRSHYGELIWPNVYGRKPMLSEEDIEILREIEEAVGVRRILMHDPDSDAHWQRCVDNKEPLTKPQFLRARNLYDRLAKSHGFEKVVLTDLPQFKNKLETTGYIAPVDQPPLPENTVTVTTSTGNSTIVHSGKSKEQQKLEKANAINDVLSKRIIKGKGEAYDVIESEVRDFLNKKLGTILGSEDPGSFSKEEMSLLRVLLSRLKQKESQ